MSLYAEGTFYADHVPRSAGFNNPEFEFLHCRVCAVSFVKFNSDTCCGRRKPAHVNGRVWPRSRCGRSRCDAEVLESAIAQPHFAVTFLQKRFLTGSAGTDQSGSNAAGNRW